MAATGLEEKIKEFVHGLGADIVVGIAGPERLKGGPPSLDPTYVMRGAKSIVTFAFPMDVEAIYQYLGKETPVPHNFDQMKGGQRSQWISKKVAEFIQSQGYKAKMVAANNVYRRSPNLLSNHPDLSHRFAGMVSGVGGQGWSGNLMTKEYGAAVYLGSTVTNAVLKSDPMIPPRYFVDNFCAKCGVCQRTCPVEMFSADDEDEILINGQLFPRGKRLNLYLCNTSCFGTHALDLRTKKWTTWGRHWIKSWVERTPDPNDKNRIRNDMNMQVFAAGDATNRYNQIKTQNSKLFPEDMFDDMPNPLPADRNEQYALLASYAERMGIKNKDANLMTCGGCSLVCGPTVEETSKRYHMLIDAGYVVPGEGGHMVNASTYEEAVAIREKYPLQASKGEILADAKAMGVLWSKAYGGFGVKSMVTGWFWERKRNAAMSKFKTQQAAKKEPASVNAKTQP
jgi:epoxyqueuosine reductase QueG